MTLSKLRHLCHVLKLGYLCAWAIISFNVLFRVIGTIVRLGMRLNPIHSEDACVRVTHKNLAKHFNTVVCFQVRSALNHTEQ